MRLSSVFLSVLLSIWFWACAGEAASSTASETAEKSSSVKACTPLPGETEADRKKRCASEG